MTTITAALVLSVSGCADDSVVAPGPSSSTEAVVFEATPAENVTVNPGTPSWETLDEETLRVYLYGSSSCVPTITGVTQVNDAVTVELKSYADDICTADYGPSVWDVSNLSESATSVHAVTPGSDVIETLDSLAEAGKNITEPSSEVKEI